MIYSFSDISISAFVSYFRLSVDNTMVENTFVDLAAVENSGCYLNFIDLSYFQRYTCKYFRFV